MSRTSLKVIEADGDAVAKPKQDEKTGRFLTGNIGGGRPIGARNKLSEAFIEALHDDFVEHGKTVIEAVRKERPQDYLKVIASLLPKDVNLAVNPYEEMSDEQLQAQIKGLIGELGLVFADGPKDRMN
ncbi:MAG: hypothetical protein AAF583_07500 [Pseudomonadota bacterium]